MSPTAKVLFAIVDAISFVQKRVYFVRGRILLAAWAAEEGASFSEIAKRAWRPN